MLTRRRGDCHATLPTASFRTLTSTTRAAQPRARTLRSATETRRWKTFGTTQRGPIEAFGAAALAVVVVAAAVAVAGAVTVVVGGGGGAGGGALVVVGGGGGGAVVVVVGDVLGGGGLEPSTKPKSSAQ